MDVPTHGNGTQLGMDVPTHGKGTHLGVDVPTHGNGTHLGMDIPTHGNGTHLGVDVFQSLHYLPEQPPHSVGTGVQVSGVNELTQCLILTVLHLQSMDTPLTGHLEM